MGLLSGCQRITIRLAAGGLAAWLALGAGSAVAEPGKDCDRLVRPGENLQSALDGLPDNGEHQTVCLASGTFAVPDMITVERSNLTLRGQGPRATLLRLAESVESPVLVFGDAHHRVPERPIRRITVENLGIRGGGEGGREFRADLPYLSNSGLIVRRGEDVVLRNLDVRHCRSACLLTEHHSRDVRIENNHVSQAQWDGISLNRAGPTRVVGNTIVDNVAAGITVEYLQGGEIVDNVIADNGSHGIYLADAEHNRFRDNLFRNNQAAGVFLTCSIRHRDPVQCWDGSFSRHNTFSHNHFEHNRHSFRVAPDDTANCLGEAAPTNVSRGDTFLASPNHEPAWERYGRCIAFEGSRVVETKGQQ